MAQGFTRGLPIDTDPTMSLDSEIVVPSQSAVRDYVANNAINTINGLTPGVQTMAVGTSGTDFAISSSVATHTFNLPTASAANRGALSSADWSTFNGKAEQDTFTMRMNWGAFNPLDATTYYFADTAASLSTSPTLFRHRFPYNCTLVGATIFSMCGNNSPSGELSTLNFRLNNTTDTLLSNAVSFAGTGFPTSNVYTVTGLNTAIAAGDFANIKFTGPTWATNPNGASLFLTLYFERT
jgi:hypothetical protein